MLQTNYFYFIKDRFYEEFSDCGLMTNYPSDDDGQHNRPCYYCLFYEELFWMIPISSRLEKYERIYMDKMRRYRKCDGIKFGYVNGERRAFLLQNIFPVTAEYVEKMYKVNHETVPVTVNSDFALEINKTARKIIRMYQRGVKIVLTNLDKIIEKLKA